ncbi:ferric reductase-like transmembrane domain-containing protein [Amycolatopsis cihanbeyliensis]|uniref:Sulfoxide reductase heme-binding subunit YedZ n=1 Tax=Amycolatopsis cihanbeyliensis TaxID=1128664 RepID=A0A542DD33_AMYCI|nr:ferric reductase-like transmembrane domain-containing protein [Amycolatopsis cihanbeyliensis]TQJ00978.1 sulfoxide reductase heme-binding subunit YedZ [Amycolatopsis cihanbeyliensis]
MPDGWAQTLIELAQPAADQGLRYVAAISARLSYAFMCLTLCWGVLTATGWVHRICGRKTMRSGHVALAMLALAFGAIHAIGFLFVTAGTFTVPRLIIPLLPGTLARHTMGILGLELAVAIAVTAGLVRLMSYRRWLWLHRLAYPAFALLVLHSLFGAIANGRLALLWLGGITLLVPTVTLAVLRFLPVRTLERIGLVEEQV